MGLTGCGLRTSIAVELAALVEEDKRGRGEGMKGSWRMLCRRKSCCPRIRLGCPDDAPWEACIEEGGEGTRGAAQLWFTEEALVELAGILNAAGYGGSV